MRVKYNIIQANSDMSFKFSNDNFYFSCLND